MMFFAEYNPLRCGKEKERRAISHQHSASFLKSRSEAREPYRDKESMNVTVNWFSCRSERAVFTASEIRTQAHAPPRLSFFD
jgi:hypothetical protein